MDAGTRTAWHGSVLENKRDASGLLYRRNRMYDPATGRFTQEDPIGLAGGMNLYGFAGGDPVNFSDPLGLCPEGVGTRSAHQEGRSVVMECEDNTDEVRSGGDPNWRMNNPGNLNSGPFAQRRGSKGSYSIGDNKFAIFSDMLTGWNNLVDRLTSDESGLDYPNMTVDQAISNWAPAFQNNTSAYKNHVHSFTGLKGTEKLNSLSNAQLYKVASTIFAHEGAQVGTVVYRPHAAP
jgi:RHS repeat-associated protein